MLNGTLKVTVRTLESGIVIELVGAVDLMTIKALIGPLNETVKATLEMEQIRPLSVDLRRVDFIDSSGLALLITTRKRLSLAGRSFQVFVTHDQQPDRVLRAGRFDTIMTLIYDTAVSETEVYETD